MANNQLLASDNFASGSLAAGWSAVPGSGLPRITSPSPFYAEPASTTGAYEVLWEAITWPNDQISECTIASLSTTDTIPATAIFLKVRASHDGQNAYQVILWGGPSSPNEIQFYKVVGGTATQIGSTFNATVNPGDIFTLSIGGSILSLYKNYALLSQVFDTSLPSGGFPGFSLQSSVNVTNAQVASWRGYSADQQSGVWTKKGIAVPIASVDGTTGVNTGTVLYEGTAHIL